MTLSDKSIKNTDVGGPDLGNVYWEKDVKEFIKELKEEMKKMFVYEEKDCFDYAVEHYINKLAGEELVK